MNDILTPREAADYRRTSIRTLDRERSEGEGPPYIRVGKRIFYKRADLDAFLAAHVVVKAA